MVFDKNCLRGRRILVTGASSGIGRTTSILLASCGATIIAIGRDMNRLQETLDLLEGSGHQSNVLDLSGSDDIAEYLQKLTKDSLPLNGIFHAAGVSAVRPVKLSKEKNIDDVFGSSIKTAFALARGASLRNVMAEQSALIFMSSVAGQRGQVGMSIYAAAKAAIDGMCKSLAVEFAPRKITVNSIVAGAVITEMHERLTQTLSAQSIQDYQDKHLLGFGEPVDIAQVAAFLFSDAGRWITGSSWLVDGGYMAR